MVGPRSEAASRGDVALAELLVGLGADPSLRDVRFDATALRWAHHFEQPAVAAFLGPLAPDGSEPG